MSELQRQRSMSNSPSSTLAFLEEVELWLSNIGKQIKALEERHRKWHDGNVEVDTDAESTYFASHICLSDY